MVQRDKDPSAFMGCINKEGGVTLATAVSEVHGSVGFKSGEFFQEA